MQALRGIASVSIVLWHSSIFLGPYGSGIGGLLFGPAAAMGVDLFFLISGFIMVYATRQDPATPASAVVFFIKRLTRIWPVYAVATLVSIAVDRSLFRGAGDLIRSLLFIPSANPMAEFPTLGVGWTLNFEMYFYAVMALSLGARSLGVRWGRWLFLAVWFAVTLVAFPIAGIELSVITQPIVWLFVIGAAIGIIFTWGPVIPAWLARIGLAVSIIAACAQYAMHFRTEHGVTNAGLTMIPLLFFSVMSSETFERNLWRPLVSFGGISYSLYLFHPLAIGLWMMAKMRYGWTDPMGGFSDMLAVVALSVVFAMICYEMLEVRLSRLMLRTLLTATTKQFRRSVRPI